MAVYEREYFSVGDRPDGFCGGRLTTRVLERGHNYLYLMPLTLDVDKYRPWVPADGAFNAVVANPCDASAATEDPTVSIFGTGKGPSERILNDVNVPGITEAQAVQARIDSYQFFQTEEVHDRVTHEFE